MELNPITQFQKILELERNLQRKFVKAVTPPSPPPPPAPVAMPVPIPVQISGFFMATSSNVVTFYVNTTWPLLTANIKAPIGTGWRVYGITGMIGNVILTKISEEPGIKKLGEQNSEGYMWSFECQTDTEQNIEGTQGVIGATLYPPDASSLVTNSITGDLSGFYYVARNVPSFYIKGSVVPLMFGEGWSVSGIPGLTGNVTIKQFVTISGRVTELWPYDSYIVLNTDYIPENTGLPIPVENIIVKQPPAKAKIIGANVQYTSETSNVTMIEMNTKLKINGGAPLRELNTGIKEVKIFHDEYKEITKQGFNSGTTMSLYAVGPQEKYTRGEDNSMFNATFPQHSNFVMYQRNIPISGDVFLGQTITIELKPKELGDLLCNMYLQCSLPALTGSSNAYTNQVGRALIAQADFMINDTVIETVYDDWFFIRDQVFLDADEQQSMFSAVNGGSSSNVSPTTVLNMVIPFEFFFCRRHSHANKGRERLRRPYLPLCAISNQRIYLKIKFNPWVWITNDLGVSRKDIINPSLILEEIKLTDAEKLYYQSTPQRYVINRVQKESALPFTNANPQIQLTANFPVQMLIWFIRNRKYESVASPSGAPSGLYYDSRYSYGYTTQYIQTAVPLTFVSGTTSFIDVIDTANIVLNGIDISSTFKGSLYYSFKQPMDHGLSVPAKNIYMYSFGLTPKEYNSGGYINFSKLNSQTTKLNLSFVPAYASQLIQGYQLYVFYYGYTILEVANGFARLPFA
jgi:hypothetical protein